MPYLFDALPIRSGSHTTPALLDGAARQRLRRAYPQAETLVSACSKFDATAACGSVMLGVGVQTTQPPWVVLGTAAIGVGMTQAVHLGLRGRRVDVVSTQLPPQTPSRPYFGLGFAQGMVCSCIGLGALSAGLLRGSTQLEGLGWLFWVIGAAIFDRNLDGLLHNSGLALPHGGAFGALGPAARRRARLHMGDDLAFVLPTLAGMAAASGMWTSSSWDCGVAAIAMAAAMLRLINQVHDDLAPLECSWDDCFVQGVLRPWGIAATSYLVRCQSTTVMRNDGIIHTSMLVLLHLAARIAARRLSLVVPCERPSSQL